MPRDADISSSVPIQLLSNLTNLLGVGRVVSDHTELIVYECDGLVLNRHLPDVVVYPETTEEIAQIVKIFSSHKIPYLARGAGTGLSGGAVPSSGGVIIQMSKMNRILDIHYEDETAVVQPGVINAHLSEQTFPHGYHFAPDPSSQKACTIGGNVAENAGGPHTLKYGVTTNHVLGLTIVLPNGDIIETGSHALYPIGYDLTGLFVGSEGTLGIVTEIIVKLTRNPQSVKTFLAVFESVDDASQAVSDIIDAGIVPAALELIDNLVINAVELHIKAGFPTHARAILLIEIDGIKSSLNSESEKIESICGKNNVVNFRQAESDEERDLLWRGRKEAIGAIGKVTPAFYTNDGVVPRSKLPEIMKANFEIAESYGLKVGHVCHAGDGNIHPVILYNPDLPEEAEKAVKVSEKILEKCIDLGGALTGEHGIGTEKQNCFQFMFNEDDEVQMKCVHSIFNPDSLLNPKKIFPSGSKCGETKIKKTLEVRY